MKVSALFGRLMRISGLAILAGCASAATFGAEVAVLKTNWVERWITNLIEIRMPMNMFVNEYHTNRVEQFSTNFLDVYATNWLTRTRTQTVTVDALRTNMVKAWQTNWSYVTRTNDVMVDRVNTNFMTQYQTNTKALTLTNWETVLLFKTNWVSRLVTNVVEIDLAGKPPPTNQVSGLPEQKTARIEVSPPAPTPIWADALVLEAARTERAPGKNQVEVRLAVRWGNTPGAALQVQQWRVEREDGAILLFGQENEFRRELPAGRYRVELRAQEAGSTLLLAARGTLEITPREAVIQQQFARAK